ncbi:MAG: Ig-like domain-containing protein, partial [Bacteroidetes bacterium]|nr:Ig-like domain-containing protein [Bacteroidota bacterium]
LNSIIEISANTSYQLEIFYQDGNGVESHPETLLWTSSDQTVIDVNEKGTLAAIGSGTATITVSLATSNTLLFA